MRHIAHVTKRRSFIYLFFISGSVASFCRIVWSELSDHNESCLCDGVAVVFLLLVYMVLVLSIILYNNIVCSPDQIRSDQIIRYFDALCFDGAIVLSLLLH